MSEGDNVACYLCGQDVGSCLIAEKCAPIEIPLMKLSKDHRWFIPKKFDSTAQITRKVAMQFREFIDPENNAPLSRSKK